MSADPANRTDVPLASVQVLLKSAIDYAGLFPPAALPVSEAVANYCSYRVGKFAWMLGRFVVPSTRLAQFFEALNSLPSAHIADKPWRVSLIAGSHLESDLAAAGKFSSQPIGRPPGAMMDSIEVKAGSVDDILVASKMVPAGLECYFELPQGAALEECAEAVRQCGRYAKVRCGGARPEQFISPEDLARFIHLCLRAGIPFKVTAGLHHPQRGRYPLTHEASGAMMHGFLNLLMAVALAQGGLNERDTAELLRDESPFRFDPGGVFWRGHYADAEQLSRARQTMHSFGSCSFTDPVRDLQEMRLI